MVAERWIINASPVIVFAKIGELALLDHLCDEIIVPQSVVDEILAGIADDPARRAIEMGWGRRRKPVQRPPQVVEWGLGEGETDVLALALESGPCTVVLDDAAARAAARTLRIPTLGTLGLIVRAKLQGAIPSAAVVIEQVRRAGLYLDERIISEVLRRIGE